MSKGNRNRKVREMDPDVPFEQYPPWLQKRLREAARTLANQAIDKYLIDADATILWTLHIGFGWGHDRLRRFFDTFVQLQTEMRKRYESTDAIRWRCLDDLKKIGVDVEAWNEASNVDQS